MMPIASLPSQPGASTTIYANRCGAGHIFFVILGRWPRMTKNYVSLCNVEEAGRRSCYALPLQQASCQALHKVV
jgi:hypothetical protein